jgi:thymidylate kinase
MIIEFIGAPGSGKTTFVPVLRDFLAEKGYSANEVLDAARPFAQKTIPGKIVNSILPGKLKRFFLWQIFYLFSFINRAEFSRTHNTLLGSVLTYQSRRPITKSDKKHVLRWFIHLTGYYQFFTKYLEPKEVLIFDEGFVHRVVQLFSSENEAVDFNAIKEYLNSIPKPDLVVFINAPEEICVERVFSRGVWDRFREKDPQDTLLFLNRAWEIVNFSIETLREKNWNIVEVHNGNTNILNNKHRFSQLLLERIVIEP